MGGCTSTQNNPSPEPQPRPPVIPNQSDSHSRQVHDDSELPVILYNNQDVKQLFTFDKVLGKGHFGITRLVVEKATGDKYACKSISKRKFLSQDDVEDVKREIQIMKHLAGHPNIVLLKEAFEDKQNIHLVMELCTGGELFESIVAQKYYTEKDAAKVMRTIMKVIAHCHFMNVVHRDLKPENFLLSDKSQQPVLKATDFGLSTWIRDGQELHDVVGSPYYVAPEVLKKKYAREADIWSCGVMMYILLCGWPPYFGDSTQQIFTQILHGRLDLTSDPWDKISDAAKDCVQRMLVRDPAKRATAAEILQHPWMLEEGGIAGSRPLKVEVMERMKRFSNLNKFKKEAVRIMVNTLSPDELTGFREMFKSMDRDRNNLITVEEFKEGLKRRGATVTEEEVEKLLRMVDIDGDNHVDIDEFLAATVNASLLEREDNIFKTFQHFDKDGSGFISKEEVRAGLRQLDDPTIDWDKMLSEIDSDGDGRINYEEFCNMIRSQRSVTDAKAALPTLEQEADAALAAENAKKG